MSGGFLEDTYRIFDMAEHIESEILKNGRYSYEYSSNTIDKFKYAVKILKKASIYAHRIDYLLSGDDGEEEFHERLAEDLKGIK